LLSVDDVPVGVQLLGAHHGDERLTATARWIAGQYFRKAA
jgi:Asp-tRNA(Asn)/Glu-tRNA(Gln) amidotransferase A subunit family amidase